LAADVNTGRGERLRRYIKSNAERVGVTGVIQLVKRDDLELCIEGTSDQIGPFMIFLQQCKDTDLISWSFAPGGRQVNRYRSYHSFDILSDRSMKVISGDYSGEDFLKIEEESVSHSSLEENKKKWCGIM
jgi:acylphosphatase